MSTNNSNKIFCTAFLVNENYVRGIFADFEFIIVVRSISVALCNSRLLTTTEGDHNARANFETN